MNYLIATLFLLFSLSNYSQNKIIDTNTKQIIPFVEIYSEDGEFLGSSDIDGFIPKNLIDNIATDEKTVIFLYHQNYENKKIILKEFKTQTNQYMIPYIDSSLTGLKEVVIEGNNKKKYKKITAYFRSVQYNESRIHYFMDGIVNFYIHRKKSKAKIEIVQNRSLSNDSIRQIDEKGTIQIGLNLTGVPNIDDYFDIRNIEKSFELQDSLGCTIVKKEKLNLGKIIKRAQKKHLNIQFFSENNSKEMSAFGTTSILNNYTVTAVYNSNLRDDCLHYFKENRSYRIKNKKELTHHHINAINEVFVFDSELTNEESNSRNNYYNFINKSDYVNDFWKDLSVNPLPESVQLFIAEKS